MFPDRASVYRLIGTQLLNVDEDWRSGRLYMAKKGIEKLFEPELEKNPYENDFILEESIINLEVQNSTYTT